MIFVTVGTTLPFDDLVRAVDAMAGAGSLDEPVTCQIGRGEYVPVHCEHYRFSRTIEEDIGRASLVIGHGGTGTVTGLLTAGRKFIAVANPLGAHDHQRQFLERLSRTASFLWTADLSELPALVEKAREFSPTSHLTERLTDDLLSYLLQYTQR